MKPLLLFHHDVVKKFDEISQSISGRAEIGGIMVGTKREENLEITSITFPGPNDISSLLSFVKKDSIHQKFAMMQWKLFGKTRTYVGEWHTHPSGFPTPSETDFKTWVSVVKKQKRNMVFVIISPTGWTPYLVAFELIEKEPVFAMKIQEKGEIGVVFSA